MTAPRCTGSVAELGHECNVWFLAGFRVGDDGATWRAAHAPLAAIGAALQDIERRDPWAPVRAIDAEIADLRLAGASTYNARRRRSAAARAALGDR